MRWLLLCPVVQSMTVFELWDDDAFHRLAARAVRLAREAGALTILPVTLTYLSGVRLFEGEFAVASALLQEADAVNAATSTVGLVYGRLLLGAWRGREPQAVQLIDLGLESANARGEGRVLALAGHATAVLNNALERHATAADAALRATEDDDQGYAAHALVELVEAAVHSGRGEVAASALARLEERTRAAGTDWSLGVLARSQALLAGDDARYREAIERLARTRMRVELARAHLVYGEWLRTVGKQAAAREHLRTAHDAFARFGAEAFAERARGALRAAGETVRRSSSPMPEPLTAQEAEIARLAADGQTNPEIGARLFISPRTVEYHLSKVFTKLGVGSRRELGGALGRPGHPSRRD